jgi:hypothetical protein
MRAKNRNRPLRTLGRAGHAPTTVPVCPPRVLDRRQRFLASGQRAAARLRAKWPNIILVHTPVHASWLNQIEVYFSIVQRKLLTPNDFANLAALRQQLMRFQQHYQQSAKPFEWTFTRHDLDRLLHKLKQKPDRLAA